MEWTRPDVALTPGAQNVPIMPMQAILSSDGASLVAADADGDLIAIANPVNTIAQPQPWGANQSYALGAQVTAGAEYGSTTAAATMPVYMCFVPGVSGATAPNWPEGTGTQVTDGSVSWINIGIFMP